MTELYLRVFSAELWLLLGTQSHLGVIFKMARLLQVLCALQTLLHCCSVEHNTVSTLLHTLLQCISHYSHHVTAHSAALLQCTLHHTHYSEHGTAHYTVLYIYIALYTTLFSVQLYMECTWYSVDYLKFSVGWVWPSLIKCELIQLSCTL